MGTGGPQVTVRAATLAGGDKNQDRYAYGDGWAFVLDGASSFDTQQPQHDGGWYAERLKNALIAELTSNPDTATTNIVAKAIEAAASEHDDPETCPTSTVAMARWSADAVEVYVLGDSTAVLITDVGEEAVSDSRLSEISPGLRSEYRSRLTAGHGFDERHRELLQQLQADQALARNRAEGYWIAGSDAEAAAHARTRRLPRSTVDAAVLSTDGAAAALRYGTIPSWRAISAADPDQVLISAREVEVADANAANWPRSKKHDDKTCILIDL